MKEWVVPVLVALFSGSTFSAFLTWRKENKRAKAERQANDSNYVRERTLFPIEVESRTIANLQNQVALIERINTNLARRTEELENDLGEARDQIAERDISIARLQAEVAAMKSEITRLGNVISSQIPKQLPPVPE